MIASPSSPSPRSAPVDSVEVSGTGRLDNASRLRIFAIVAVIVLYTEVCPLQYTMVAAALQKMTKSFPTVGANINWTIIILGLVGASASPLLGKASDIWGKKRMFLVCGVFFFAGCLIDALTTNWTLFLIGRGLQAFAIATQLIAYGLIRDLLPRRYIPVSLGVVGAGLGLSTIIAPLVGGYLVDHYNWQAMFWFLAIFTIVMTPLVMFVVPESKLKVRDRIDPVGAILLSAGALLTLLYLDKGQDWGWGRPSAWAWLIGGLVLLALFFVIETRVSRPIMDMKLLAHPKVSMVLLMVFFGVGITAVQPYALGYMTQTPNAAGLKGIVAQGVVAQAHQMANITIPISSIHVAFNPGYTYGSGWGMLQYGLHVGMWAGISSLVFGPIGGLLARRYGARVPALLGLAVLAALAVGFAFACDGHYSWQLFLVLTLLFGIGFGFFFAAAANMVVEAVPEEQQGISVGMLGVMQGMGTAVGLAVITALLNENPVKANINALGHSITEPIPGVFADKGYVIGFWVMAGFSILALVIGALMRHGRNPATGGALEEEQLELAEA